MVAVSITEITITPVAFRDPPLLNATGVHEPYALRAIIEITTDAGISGLGETYGDAGHLHRLSAVARSIVGLDAFALNEIYARTAAAIGGASQADATGLTGMIDSLNALDSTYSPFEVACLDIQGRALGRPVSDLLGGAVHDTIPYSAYLFYKWAGHPGASEDRFGAALDPAGVVAQARWMVDEYGFSALKLKGGVFAPEAECEAILAFREAFPRHPLRLDPNAAWTHETSVRVATTLDGVLEYLEDPTPTIAGMAHVAREVPVPLATNMCVVGFADLPPAIEQRAVGVVLSDHHYWGGLTRVKLLSGIGETFGVGLSMHSNSHLGISLAAMTQLAATIPELPYALDTHWPWKDEDVISPGVLEFAGGSVRVTTTPGLGVELDRDALAHLHERYLACGIRSRDDTAYMRRIDPSYQRRIPRW